MSFILQKLPNQLTGSTYSRSAGDFNVTVTGTDKVATVVGLGFSFDALAVQYAFYRDVAGQKYELDLNSITVTSNAITFTNKPANFAATDEVEVYILGNKKSDDRINNVVRTQETNALNLKAFAESFVDTTNVAATTLYYPSPSGMLMDGKKDLSLSGKLIPAGNMALTLEVTNDEDPATADWIQVYAYDDKNNTTKNSWSVATPSTLTFAISLNNLNYKYFRVKLVNDNASNTTIIKARYKAL